VPNRSVTNKPRPLSTETPEGQIEKALDQLRALPVRLTTLVADRKNGFYILRYRADPAAFPTHEGVIVATKDYQRFVRILSDLYGERHGKPRRKPAGISRRPAAAAERTG
jgi:hypothetical protein